ncbi:ribose 1,5-bisphosphate phosphokinase PhnN [Cypionkella aquatica]|uniref:Ribose 1,5-bisphosphate phosphokinase PhnN n=1 Tax=Cypionkella aquatica TaxID=1756042 RepID=A0AA37U700_9RHOB|nr:phosphonate metabolism protein/1,5-bisphosphokinase (PRPP-forming) PhnN [Cypionkella aquatica]GLS86621.1 ribose 1,5-bisphosphate phosphokinase PhnN [Cypionkella aquatica]
MTGQLFLVVGPSGAGKDTLLAGAVAADPRLHWARRVITRAQVAGGEPFEGVSAPAFQARLQAGEFALHWQAHGLSYGVDAAELAPLAQGRNVLINGSRAALAGALAAYPGLRVIQISAPPEVLADRLALRGRENRAEIADRLKRASYALPEGLPAIEISNDATPEKGIAKLLYALRG